MVEVLRSWAARSRILIVVLSAIALLSAYIRIVLPWGKIFTPNGIVLQGNDPYYHTRLIENTIANFPVRMWFDPMTYFPHGSHLYWGPIHDQTVALLALIVGLGSPSTHTVYAVNALFPALLGVALVIPAYGIASKLYGKKAGVLAALLIAILPGQLLNRTMLGFADHHADEILFSALVVLLTMLALERSRGLTLSDLGALLSSSTRTAAWRRMRVSVLYLALASLSYTFYQLSWTGALMLVFVMLLFFAAYAVIEHMRGGSIEHLALVSVGLFLFPLLAILPIVDYSTTDYLYYSLVHVLALSLAVLSGPVLALLSVRLKRYPAWAFPLVLALLVGLLIFTLSSTSKDMGATLSNIFTLLTKPTIGELTIAEATPIFFPAATGGKFTLAMVNGNFGIAFYISLLAMPLLAYRYVRSRRPSELLVLVWSIVMFWAMYQQNRFAYYYAVNVAVLTGYLVATVLDAAGMRPLSESYAAFERGALSLAQMVRGIGGWNAFLVLLVLAILVWPWGTLAGAQLTAERAGGPPTGWLDALHWLNDSTPEPGVDYYAIYNESFHYPSQAYGVLSWWDYGHWILAIGHRMPNANPFQQGIGGGPDHRPGASTFFTALNESKANEIADTLHTRYVITDIEMATGKFYAMTAWALDTEGWVVPRPYGIMGRTYTLPVSSEKFTSSMTARLHFDDAKTLSHYRLVYESPGYIVSYQLLFINQGMLTRGMRYFSSYEEAEQFYHQILPFYVDTTNRVVAFDAKPPASYVKVFEYVKGATIEGGAPDGTPVSVSTTISTGGRTFTYTQRTVAVDGHYSLTVPYSTLGSHEGSTLYDAGPIKPYTLTIGTTEITLDVSEDDVINGETIFVG